MREMIINHYSDFEGEPEIKFICESNGNRIILKIWEGYFDEIMRKIKPNAKGWTGLAYYYHLHEGWYDINPWEIPDLKLAIEQLVEINIRELDETVKNVLVDILKLLKKALSTKAGVIIEYF